MHFAFTLRLDTTCAMVFVIIKSYWLELLPSFLLDWLSHDKIINT